MRRGNMSTNRRIAKLMITKLLGAHKTRITTALKMNDPQLYTITIMTLKNTILSGKAISEDCKNINT
jgi:hypothetical protein